MTISVEEVVALLIRHLLSRGLLTADAADEITMWDIEWARLIAGEEE